MINTLSILETEENLFNLKSASSKKLNIILNNKH